MEKHAIVVVAYNRIASLERILNRLLMCTYDNPIDLIISIDHSDVQEQLVNLSKDINWIFGHKKIIERSTRLGLREHILQCGDLVKDYDAIVMFEDDIMPSKHFYKYVKDSLKFYKGDAKVGGISLYSPSYNEMAEKPFIPIKNEYDTYLLQSASSWGQCWSKEMWLEFREWYSENDNELINNHDLPQKVYSWPETSWKKYFMKFLVVKNKYFVYPYTSLSTNLSDMGQHVKQEISITQVPLLSGDMDYNFSPYESAIKYDAFFENQYIEGIMGDDQLVCVDLYGTKTSYHESRYLLTMKNLNYEVVREYGLSYRPHEINVLYEYPGDTIFMYDLNAEKINGKKKKARINTYYSSLDWKDSFTVFLEGFKDTLVRKLKKLIIK